MNPQTLQALCQGFSERSILVVGDVILDHFVYGSVDRISPESPVPVLSNKRQETMLGGAGNSFANLLGLGIKAQLLSVIGADQAGRDLKDLIAAGGADPEGLLIDESRPTSLKTRFLAGHQQLLRSDFETKEPIDDAMAAQLVDRFEALLPTLDVVILSDYGKGVLRPDVIARLMTAANAANVPVIVDPKGHDFSIYRGAFAVTPNRKELADATGGRTIKTDEQVCAAARFVMETCGIGNVFATRSEDGISVVYGDETLAPYHVRPSQQVEVFDVSGAGDTVIATLAATIAVGGALDQAATLANLAGHIAVSKVGTTPIRLSELELAVAEQGQGVRGRLRYAPLRDVQGALEDVKRWRAKGLRVGFTNGCFDIVHAGHVTYLDSARNHCDRLIVGLNRDASIKILKGEGRPIHDEAARARVIGALACVDLVILFGAQEAGQDNTACALLEALQPDLYFKGGDYTVDQIPEAPTVQAYGGQVKVLENIEGYSTTLAIEKSKIA